MTTLPSNPRIDRRTRLGRGENEGSVVSCQELLAELNSGEREEKVKAPKSESAMIIQRHETEVSNEKCNEMLCESLPSILNTLLAEARSGNMQATKFVVDRVLPDPRDTRVKLDLREIKGVDDAIGAWHDVFAAISQGVITLKEAQSVCALLKSYIDTNGVREFSSELADLGRFVKKPA